MCMCVDSYEKLGIKHGWKILMYYKRNWRTPIELTIIKNNELVARGKLSNNRMINGGAIHCFRTKKEAEKSWLMYITGGGNLRCAIFKVKGIGEIAHNKTKVAFKKVKFIDIVDDWEII